MANLELVPIREKLNNIEPSIEENQFFTLQFEVSQPTPTIESLVGRVQQYSTVLTILSFFFCMTLKGNIESFLNITLPLSALDQIVSLSVLLIGLRLFQSSSEA